MYVMCLIIIEMRQFPIYRSIRIHIDLLIGQCPSLYIAAIVFRYWNIQRIMKSMKYPSDVHYTSVVSCRSFMCITECISKHWFCLDRIIEWNFKIIIAKRDEKHKHIKILLIY